MTKHTPEAIRAAQRIIESVLPPQDPCRRPATLKALVIAGAAIISEETGDLDLLAALEIAAEGFDKINATGHPKTVQMIAEARAKQARAAIAKARGEG